MLNANANALSGKGGYENVSQLGGDAVVSLTFCDIGNIHAMRESIAALAAG